MVVELAAVVALQCTDRAPELGGYPGEEVSEGGEREIGSNLFLNDFGG